MLTHFLYDVSGDLLLPPLSSLQVRKNLLDVSHHVSQYQNIISELRTEIGRLKEKIVAEGHNNGRSASGRNNKAATKKQAEELRELRDEMVANFREQMKLRYEGNAVYSRHILLTHSQTGAGEKLKVRCRVLIPPRGAV